MALAAAAVWSLSPSHANAAESDAAESDAAESDAAESDAAESAAAESDAAEAAAAEADAAEGPVGAESLPPAALRFETGRQPMPAPRRDTLRLQLHGEYQARLSALSDLPLYPHPLRPGTDSLEQTTRLEHWLRITPVLQLFGQFQLVAQADFPRGLIAGRENQWVGAAAEPLDDRHPLRFDLRWLYAEWLSSAARFRGGLQPSHFGLGMVENDGDHPTPFGDYRGGNRVVRTELSVTPAGASSPFRVRLAGDVVYVDPFTDLDADDTAIRAVLSAHYETADESFLAVYGALRHQRTRDDTLPGFEFHQELDTVLVDSAGRLRAAIPGASGWIFAEYEAAVRAGTTTMLRTVDQQRTDEREQILGWGALGRIGAAATSGSGPREWASLVGSLEWGFASGDADPYDGTYRRFDFNPNHNVGLILFDEVLAWKTARAATLARDASLVGRAAPGSAFGPSNGGVFGAMYVHPRLLWRPVRRLDLQLGAVVAQSTADVVDPTELEQNGRYANYDGGDPEYHDLGLELDAGVEYRLPVEPGLALQFGAQGGVFFPGRAFANATGHDLPTQTLAMGRLGILY